jgi:hypothetical protein
MNTDRDIEDWCNDNMGIAEREVFERRLAQDEDLRQTVEQHKKLMLDLKEIGLRRQVRAASNANQLLAKRRRWVLAMAVTVVGLFAFLLWRMIRYPASTSRGIPGPTQQPVLEQQSSPVPTLQKDKTAPLPQDLSSGPIASDVPKTKRKEQPVFRSGELEYLVDSTWLSLFKANFEDYRPAIGTGGSFEPALRLMEASEANKARQVLAARNQNDTAQYLLAIMDLRAERPQSAAQQLLKVYGKNSTLKPEAQWLLALAWLLQGKDDVAERAFRSMAGQAGHPHQARAEGVLNKIE